MSAIADGVVPDHDMHDTPSELEATRRWPPLHDALVVLDAALGPAFDTADRRALASQRRYRWVILVTAWGGSLAVLGALGQLTFEQLDLPRAAVVAGWLELGAIAATALGVLAGLGLFRLENWLLERFRAEQLRLLKFRMLLDPRIWTAGPAREEWRAALTNQRDAIAALARGSLAAQSEREVVPRLPSPVDCVEVDANGLLALLAYYRRKRIDVQRAYFASAASRGGALLDRPRLLPAFFFASVLMVAAHVAVDHLGAEGAPWRRASIWLIAASAALPVTWAGIRTWRSAREFTRNVARSTARRDMLDEVTALVADATAAHPSHLLCHLQMCELVLESDQREWLRLMREVEWYG